MHTHTRKHAHTHTHMHALTHSFSFTFQKANTDRCTTRLNNAIHTQMFAENALHKITS